MLNFHHGNRAAVAMAALLINYPGYASTSLRTVGSARIQEAAAVSIVGNAPLQMVLTSGAPTVFGFTVAPAASGVPGSPQSMNEPARFAVNGSGLLGGVTGTGEVLSVTMDGEAPLNAQASAGGSEPEVKVVIAQFN